MRFPSDHLRAFGKHDIQHTILEPAAILSSSTSTPDRDAPLKVDLPGKHGGTFW